MKLTHTIIYGAIPVVTSARIQRRLLNPCVSDQVEKTVFFFFLLKQTHCSPVQLNRRAANNFFLLKDMCPAKSLFWSDKTKMWSDIQKTRKAKSKKKINFKINYFAI